MRSVPAATELVSSALGPALVTAGDEPLVGALHTSAGSGGELRSVICSPGPSLSTKVNGPVVAVIVACFEPLPIVPPPGTPTDTWGVSRETAMCIFAGCAVGDP